MSLAITVTAANTQKSQSWLEWMHHVYESSHSLKYGGVLDINSSVSARMMGTINTTSLRHVPITTIDTTSLRHVPIRRIGTSGLGEVVKYRLSRGLHLETNDTIASEHVVTTTIDMTVLGQFPITTIDTSGLGDVAKYRSKAAPI